MTRIVQSSKNIQTCIEGKRCMGSTWRRYRFDGNTLPHECIQIQDEQVIDAFKNGVDGHPPENVHLGELE
jgi:hypothetical protein